MTSRRFGDSGAGALDVMLAQTAVIRTGTVDGKEVINGRILYSVSFPNAAEGAAYCEACNISAGDKTNLVGQRVLVAQLGDGRAVIIGALNNADPNLSATPNPSASPNQTHAVTVGVDDRVVEWHGSQIVFTPDGDIILKPKRAVRVQTAMMRVEVDGDASDNPVAARPFVEWARAVDAMLERHEAFITATTGLGVNPTGGPPVPHFHLPPVLPASLPDIDSLDVSPPGVKMPTGGS